MTHAIYRVILTYSVLFYSSYKAQTIQRFQGLKIPAEKIYFEDYLFEQTSLDTLKCLKVYSKEKNNFHHVDLIYVHM